MDASDDQSWLWKAGDCPGWPAKAVLGPRFQWSSVFPGNCSYIYIYIYIYTHTHTHIYKSLSVHECEGVAVIFSVKKEKAKITKQCVWPL